MAQGDKSVTIQPGELRSVSFAMGFELLGVCACLVAAYFAIEASGEHDGALSPLVGHVFAGAMLLLGAAIAGPMLTSARVRRGVVTASAIGVTQGDAWLLPRQQIARGELRLAAEGGFLVHLDVHGVQPAVLVVVRDEAEGQAVLDALGLRGGTSAVTFETSGFRRVTVGTDGVVIADVLGRRRRVPHDEIKALAFDDSGLSLRLTKESLRLPVRGRRSDATAAAFAYRRSSLARGIEEARAAGLLGGSSNAALALEVASPDLAAIIDRGTYRDMAVTRDSVWAIVEDPAAPALARVRSAAALRVSPDEAQRLRVAAEATADPDLREALEATAASRAR